MMKNRREAAKKMLTPSKARRFSTSSRGHSPRRHLPTSLFARNGKLSSSGEASTNMKVVVRVRPLSHHEQSTNARQIIKIVDERMLIFDPQVQNEDFFFRGQKQAGRDMLKKQQKNSEFLFDKVYGVEATNEEVFEGSTKSIVSSILDGYNCSVFAYGATGAGKTFTMLGTEINPGITFLTMVELFKQIESLKNEKEFDFRVSYMEVYNENVQDLLSPSGPLHLREDGNGVMVAGIRQEKILDPAKMFELLKQGNRNRSQHATDANAESSRSHAIFQVYIKMTTKATCQAKFVKLSMIDLAGSERGSATKCAGIRFKEGSNINKSLLALGNCINALADGLRHIPYRDSKLTRILKDSLGGNCQTVMIANLSPSPYTFEDTHNTLKYATRAKAIKFKIKRNTVSVELNVSKYIKMNEALMEENTLMKTKLKKLEEELETFRNSTYPPCASGQSSNTFSMPAVEAPIQQASAHVDASKSSESESKVRGDILSTILEKADKLYQEKSSLQERYLKMDSSEKIILLRVQLKEKIRDRVRSMSSTPSRAEESNGRVERSLLQLNGRLASANDCQSKLFEKQNEIDHQLQSLKEEAKMFHLTDEFNAHLKTLEFQFKMKELFIQGEHYEKLIQIWRKGYDSHDQLITEISEVFRHYYNVLRGRGFMTCEMLEKYAILMRHLEGIKSVNWVQESSLDTDREKNQRDDISSVSKLSVGSSPVLVVTEFPQYQRLSVSKSTADESVKPLNTLGRPEREEASSSSLLNRALSKTTKHLDHPLDNDLHALLDSKPLSTVEYGLDSLSPAMQRPDSTEKLSSERMPSGTLRTVENARDSLPFHSSKFHALYTPLTWESMDTATTIDSLGQLTSRVECLLNSDKDAKNGVEEDHLFRRQNLNVSLPSLNSSFDASDKFQSTFKKDVQSDDEKPVNLNITFEKHVGIETVKADLDVLNSTFEVNEPRYPSPRPVNPGPNPVGLSNPPQRTNPSSKSFKTPQPLVNSNRRPQSAVTSSDPTGAKRKALLLKSASTGVTKHIGAIRKPGTDSRMLLTPGKVKAIGNKENRNVIFSSEEGKVNSKFNSRVGNGIKIISTTNNAGHGRLINSAVTKGKPKCAG